MKKYTGFTLIELVMFITITSILATTVMLSMVTALQNAPKIMPNVVAAETARACADWYLGQRRMNGYSSITCSSTVPSFCSTIAASGYNVAVSCATTNVTLYGTTSAPLYDTITITVSGNGNATTTLLLWNY